MTFAIELKWLSNGVAKVQGEIDKMTTSANNATAAVSGMANKINAWSDNFGDKININSRKLKSAIGGLALNASMFAGAEAQKWLLPLILFQKELKGLQSAASIAGMSLPGVGVAILGISGIVLMGVQAFNTYRAEMEEIASFKALQEQFEKSIPNLKKLLDKEKSFGTLDAATVAGLKNNLTDASTKSPEHQEKVLQEVLAILKKAQTEDRRAIAESDFNKYLKDTSDKFLEGAAKEKADLKKTFDEIVSKGTDIALRANVSTKPLLDLANKLLGQKLGEIDAAELQKRIDADRKLIEEKRREQLAEDEARLNEYDHLQKMIALENERKIARTQGNPFLTEDERYRQRAALGDDMTNEVNPNSFTENISAQFVRLQNQIGTFSQASAGLLISGLGTAIDGISDGIMGLIDGTRSWSQTWIGVLRTMAGQGIQFIVQQTAMFLLNKAKELLFHTTTETAKTVATVAGAGVRSTAALGEAGAEAVSTGAKAAGSVADIPYVGWALAIAAFGGVIAMIANASKNARALGGPVSAGSTYLVGENGPELFKAGSSGQIFSADKTAAFLGNMASLHGRLISPTPITSENSSAGAAVRRGMSGGGGDTTVNVPEPRVEIHYVNTEAQVRRIMESNVGKKIVVKHIDRGELGLQT